MSVSSVSWVSSDINTLINSGVNVQYIFARMQLELAKSSKESALSRITSIEDQQ